MAHLMDHTQHLALAALPPATLPRLAAPHALCAPSHPDHRFGRIRNAPTNIIPHFDHLKAHFGIEPAPVTFDYSQNFPADSDALYNNSLGNCAFAGHYHRLQVVVLQLTGVFLQGSLLRDLARAFYEECGGYDPDAPDGPDGQNPTDGGGDMEQIAAFLMTTGLMLPDGTRDRYTACFNVDPHSAADLAYCASECLGIGLGVVMTDAVMPADGSPPLRVWPAGGKAIGGHFVWALARAADGTWTCDSWGGLYQLSPDFMAHNVEQVIAYVSTDSLKDGKTVLGLDLAQWQGVMSRHAAAFEAQLMRLAPR